MAEIKRYTTAQIISQKLGCEFVKYDEIKHLLDQPECNCEEKLATYHLPQLQIGETLYRGRWICPRHGYMKL